jgi:hypothetical protein
MAHHLAGVWFSRNFSSSRQTFLPGDYSVLKIEQARMDHRKTVKKKVTADTIIPWTAIVNPAGAVLCTSEGPDGNIGWRIAIEQRSFYLKDPSAVRSTESDFAEVSRKLDGFA